MYQIEEYGDGYIVLFNEKEIGRFNTEKEAKRVCDKTNRIPDFRRITQQMRKKKL